MECLVLDVVIRDQHSGNTCRHKCGQRSTQHRPKTQSSEIRTAFGRDAADAAELNADRAEVRESAQSVGEDHHRPGTEVFLHRCQIGVGDKFIEHHFRTEYSAGLCAFVPGDPHQPGQWAKHITEQELQRPIAGRCVTQSSCDFISDPTHNRVSHCDQSNKRDQHGSDIQGERQTGRRTFGRRFDHVDASGGVFHFHHPNRF